MDKNTILLLIGGVVIYLFLFGREHFNDYTIHRGYPSLKGLNERLTGGDSVTLNQSHNNYVGCKQQTQYINPFVLNPMNKSNCGNIKYKDTFKEGYDNSNSGLPNTSMYTSFEKSNPMRKKNNDFFYAKKHRERFEDLSINAGSSGNLEKNFVGRLEHINSHKNNNVPVSVIAMDPISGEQIEVPSKYKNYTTGYSNNPEKFSGGDSTISWQNDRPSLFGFQMSGAIRSPDATKVLNEKLYGGEVESRENSRPNLTDYQFDHYNYPKSSPSILDKGIEYFSSFFENASGSDNRAYLLGNQGPGSDSPLLRQIAGSSFDFSASTRANRSNKRKESFRAINVYSGNRETTPLTKKRLVSNLPIKVVETMKQHGYSHASDKDVMNMTKLALSSPTISNSSLPIDTFVNSI